MLLGLAGCGGGSGAASEAAGPQGALVAKPAGGYFLADPHRGGRASGVRLVEILWGRLVDVHDVDGDGRTSALPVLRDVVVAEHVLAGEGLRLETNPVTSESRLVVERPRDAPDTGAGTFASVLARATAALPAVQPRADGGTFPPVSVVPRNAALVLRFDDLLRDDAAALLELPEVVRLLSGYPPLAPERVRVVFDPSHGGLAEGEFHSTRVLVDFAVSTRDAAELPYPVPIDASGAPPSSAATLLPNAAVRLTTELDAASGRFARLTNLAGRALRREGPVDLDTGDLVRAFRTGNAADANAGFLLDLQAPRLLGAFELDVEAAREDEEGPPGLGFVLACRFRTPCRADPRAGDAVEVGSELYEVRAQAGEPDADGRVAEVRVLRLAESPLPSPDELLGPARLLTTYRADDELLEACWIGFVPVPARPPLDGIPSEARATLRFSEPMDPDTFRAFDTFRVLRSGAVAGEPRANDIVVGAVRVEPELRRFDFVPRLPLANAFSLQYFVELVSGPDGVRDLSGTPLDAGFGRAEFFLDGAAAPERNGGFALRFESRDEALPIGLADLRGQVTYDEPGGLVRPRPVTFASRAAERASPLQSLMVPFAPGVQTPLSSFGSKLQTVWRYCDFGFRVADESKYDLDVIGLSWSPSRGSILADFFPLFEMRLAHSRQLPDESGNANTGPLHPASGLLGKPNEFTDNLLVDPRGEPKVVHDRFLGYRLRQADLTATALGTLLLPFPWNHSGGPLTSFTWRDTSVVAKGGAASPGVPLDVEVGPPLFLDQGVGSFAGAGEVPSVGLPLLLEVRCFPSSQSLGFNSLDILLPIPGFNLPNFRAFSTGGVDQSGRPVFVDPDLEASPRGGYNPNSRPPGRPTPLSADNSFYVAGIDTVVRLTRAVTAWMASESFAPRWVEPVIEPRAQVGAAAIVVEYRGASGFSLDSGDGPFDAARLDPYGDYSPGEVLFHGDGTWSDDLRSIDGASFVQVRFTFVNDVQGGFAPVLDSFGLAFEER